MISSTSGCPAGPACRDADEFRRSGLRDADLLGGRQVLVAEEHHLVGQERIVHVGEIVVAHVGEVDAMKLGAERAGNGLHFDRVAAHPVSSVA